MVNPNVTQPPEQTHEAPWGILHGKHTATSGLGRPLSAPLAECRSVPTGLLHILSIYLCQAEFWVVIVIKSKYVKMSMKKRVILSNYELCEARKTILNCTFF